MRNFRAFAMASALATYFLIFLGGLVRVSGAGLGCPDWPKCFGGWIPPINASQLPADIDPNLFNFTLAWIEYVNRLAGIIVGLMIAILAIWAIIKYSRHIKILIPSVIAAILVAFQGWQGGQVVASKLEPIIISAHLVNAFIIASLLIYVAQRAYYMEFPDTEQETAYPRGMQAWAGILWLAALVQVILGTQLREAIEIAIDKFPLLPDSSLLSTIGAIKYIHPIFGIILAVAAIIIVLKTLSKGSKPSSLVWQSGWTLIGLMIIQLFLGAILITIGVAQVAQVLHLWVASLIIGVILISFTALGRRQEVQNAG